MSALRALRRRVLTPGAANVRLDVRGFHEKSPAARDLLESVGTYFLKGYAYAAEARTVDEAEDRLDTIVPRFRGFAYEGAAMGFAVRDGLPLSGGRNVTNFLAGRGADHIYMTYIGVGWALARIPRMRWSRLRVTDPLLSWLVLDGYGFHQAYFHTRRHVEQQFRDVSAPWPIVDADPQYAGRALDQGTGRALWFIGGTDVDVVINLITSFPAARHADLFSGAGLAATYAGGVDERELRRFWDCAGAFRPQVAQGSAFAAGARVRANLVVPHNDLATEVFCGMSTAEAAKVTDDTLPEPGHDGDVPLYEEWRQRIASAFEALGRC